jgi:RNA polymerase sigma factor (TIGR02999 family)
MSDATQILEAIERGDPRAADQLLPLVYDELRRLAALKLAHEKPGQTLQATALVHEAYLRLVDVNQSQHWNSRGHFFAAAAEAMRRILVENARHRNTQRGGSGAKRVELSDNLALSDNPPEQILALDEAIQRLAERDPLAARVVALRYFVGLKMQDVADALGIPLRTAERNWAYARSWLHKELAQDAASAP